MKKRIQSKSKTLYPFLYGQLVFMVVIFLVLVVLILIVFVLVLFVLIVIILLILIVHKNHPAFVNSVYKKQGDILLFFKKQTVSIFSCNFNNLFLAYSFYIANFFGYIENKG